MPKVAALKNGKPIAPIIEALSHVDSEHPELVDTRHQQLGHLLMGGHGGVPVLAIGGLLFWEDE